MATKRRADGAGPARPKEEKPRGPKRPPGLIRAPSPVAVEAARRVLSSFPFRRPGDIDLRLIASSLGIVPCIERLDRGEGMLVRHGGRGLAIIDTDVAADGGFSFGLAHELAHAEMQSDQVDFDACVFSRGKAGGRRPTETLANDFGAEVTMPSDMFGAELARLGGPAGATLEHILELADTFSMPDDAIAIKMLLFTPLACGVVYSLGGRTRWFVRNERFTTVIPFGARVPESSLAARLHAGRAIPRRGQSIASGAWDRSDGKRELREEAVRLKKRDAVLTWLVEV